MKKKLSLVLTLALMLSLAACGGQTDPPGSPPNAPDSGSAAAPELSGNAGTPDAIPAAAGDGGILIAYFGVPETDGTDTVANASRVATEDGVVGNCQFIAQAIQQAVGGDLFAIETVQEYPGTHQPLLDFAYDELRRDARPELSGEIENPDDYSVIFLGYPNWNADLPMPLYTFLESYDFSGKTIVPFVTHGGSGFSRTVSTIQELQPNAAVLTDGLSISRNSVPNAAQEAMDWALEILS
nr:flavodoxin [uncultured Oscillibacter sp.]